MTTDATAPVDASADDPNKFYFNGIDGTTGKPITPAMTADELVDYVRNTRPNEVTDEHKRRQESNLGLEHFGLPSGIDQFDLTQTGWAVIFPAGVDPARRAALKPLLDLRKSQSGDLYKELECKPGESSAEFLTRHGMGLGQFDAEIVPYYLLIAALPTEVSFEVQYGLDVDYAVGRLAFDNTDGYARYAESVVKYETATSLPQQREVVYWGPRHDNATRLSADSLITPLWKGVPPSGTSKGKPAVALNAKATDRGFLEDEATKTQLSNLLHATDGKRPSLLFTASHGLEFPSGNPKQRTTQGALLCQDWGRFAAPDPSEYFAASDLTSTAAVSGMMVFCFACYGGGTPQFNNFVNQSTPLGAPRPQIAPAPFVSALAQRLLSHENGSALAVFAHIERAWEFSIRPAGVPPQIGPFRDALTQILKGARAAQALNNINGVYASNATDLLRLLDLPKDNPEATPQKLVLRWIQRTDAQNYVLLGDPAVRIRTELLGA